MKLFERIEQWLIWLSRLGKLGVYLPGRLIAPLIMIPILFIGRFIGTFSCDVFYLLVIGLMVLAAISVSVAVRTLPLERAHEIVFPRLLGMGIAFFYVPLTTTMIAWGFGIYTVLLLIMPRIMRGCCTTDGESECSLLGGPLGLFTNEFFAGMITCPVLHILQLAGI
jgi:hypothetical protein